MLIAVQAQTSLVYSDIKKAEVSADVGKHENIRTSRAGISFAV